MTSLSLTLKQPSGMRLVYKMLFRHLNVVNLVMTLFVGVYSFWKTVCLCAPDKKNTGSSDSGHKIKPR